MRTYMETQELLRSWLNGETVKATGFIVAPSYIDFTTPSGRLKGTAAVKFNRNVLVRKDFDYPNERLTQKIFDAAEAVGFKAMAVEPRQLDRLRACLHSGSMLPATREVRSFMGWLPDLTPDMQPFPRIDHPIPAITTARITNALQLNGEMTHVILTEREDDGETRYFIHGFYANADDAMLAYMQLKKPEGYKMMEIGG